MLHISFYASTYRKDQDRHSPLDQPRSTLNSSALLRNISDGNGDSKVSSIALTISLLSPTGPMGHVVHFEGFPRVREGSQSRLRASPKI